jgi:hypothetical protein
MEVATSAITRADTGTTNRGDWYKQRKRRQKTLGRVDGFDQDKAASKRDERAVILRRLLASKRDTLEALELADRLFDACPRLVVYFWKKAGMSFVLYRYGIAGHIPRGHAASRFDL